MSRVLLPEGRSVKILNLLKVNGPLSSRAIKALLEPKISSKSLQAVLRYLMKNGLLQIRNEKIFGGHGVYYQLRQDEISRLTVANILKCDASELYQHYFRSRELKHSEDCAEWANELLKMFPDAKVLLEREFSKCSLVSDLIISTQNNDDFKPDLILLLSTSDEKNPTSIAIEIERSMKSKKRLRYKLNKYANGSRFDGLLYVCNTSAIHQAIKNVYLNSVFTRAPRVKHYRDLFLMFSDKLSLRESNKLLTATNPARNVSIHEWISFLHRTPDSLRGQSANTLLRVDPK